METLCDTCDHMTPGECILGGKDFDHATECPYHQPELGNEMPTVTITKQEHEFAIKAIIGVKDMERLAKELLECLNDEMKFHGRGAERTLETIDRAIEILYGGEK